MESASGIHGDTITLSENLNNNPGLLVGAQLNTNYGSPYTISWIDGAATTNNTKTGTIANFTFKILDNVELGDSVVTLQFIDFYNTDYNKNSFSASSGKVTVTCKHNYSSSVTKQPTCKEEGIKTFTCSVCNATKTESIYKKTTHTYYHACDTDCNVCGVTRATTHIYKTFWSSDNTNHWHECTVCKNKKDVATHTPGAEATEETAQTCTTCSYIIKAALLHNHNFANTYTTNDSGHWYECYGCAEMGNYTDHDFENECDKDCSICGYIRETVHKFSETWNFDANNHWYVCSACGLKNNEATHEPVAEATDITAQVCKICNYEISPAFGEEETTENTDVTTPRVLTEEDESKGGNFHWWIAVAIAVAVVGGVVVVVVIKRRK